MGDHLNKRRLELGLFQRDVASRVGVNESTVLNWESNACAPAIRFIPRIIAFLGYDPYPAPELLPDQLLAQRRHLGLSRRRMAKELAVDEGTLARWENGTSRPSGRRLRLVERLFTSEA